ncbi:hypothetical protein ACWEO4_05185 [Streptomyces sp. NPDC004393]|uniref:hypothetical protein n=1 Tax=Streptomyces sp. NPDC004533 TaxID=3154278 RepID=UPI0033B8031C
MVTHRPGRRDFAIGRFGLPMLAAVFFGTDWRYEGSVQENIERVDAQRARHEAIAQIFDYSADHVADRLPPCLL